MNKFGEKILNLRSEKGMTTKEIAEAVAIPQSRYSELEKGIRIPTEGQVRRLENFFNMPDNGLAALLKSN